MDFLPCVRLLKMGEKVLVANKLQMCKELLGLELTLEGTRTKEKLSFSGKKFPFPRRLGEIHDFP